jgi:hypothetical protein
MEYEKLNTNWNADPNSPDPIVWVNDGDLIVDFFLNHFVFDQFQEGDRARIIFKDCSKYSLNHCNDEGYYRGQYRTNPNELPWGEFYEITKGFDRDFPEPVEVLNEIRLSNRHYIFFFRDNTLELLAENYKFKNLDESQNQFELLQIIWRIYGKIQMDSDVIRAGYENYQIARNDIENLIRRIRQADSNILDDLDLYFAPTGRFQELSIANGWDNEFLKLADEFDDYKRKNATQHGV